jgi:hypothetical protein
MVGDPDEMLPFAPKVWGPEPDAGGAAAGVGCVLAVSAGDGGCNAPGLLTSAEEGGG